MCVVPESGGGGGDHIWTKNCDFTMMSWEASLAVDIF